MQQNIKPRVESTPCKRVGMTVVGVVVRAYRVPTSLVRFEIQFVLDTAKRTALPPFVASSFAFAWRSLRALVRVSCAAAASLLPTTLRHPPLLLLHLASGWGAPYHWHLPHRSAYSWTLIMAMP